MVVQFNPVALALGPFSIHWYGLMYIIGIVAGVGLVWSRLRNSVGLSVDAILSLVTAIVLGILVGGRFGYIVFYNFPFYFYHPLEILAYWHGGMSYHGGAIGALVGVAWAARQLSIDGWRVADLLALASTPGIALGRIGNFINGELYGNVTTMPWGVIFPAGGMVPRHPSQLYEAVAEGLVLGAILIWITRNPAHRPGWVIGLYCFLYGIFRFGIEFFRYPDPQIGTIIGLSLGQWLCMGMIGIGMGLLWAKRCRG